MRNILLLAASAAALMAAPAFAQDTTAAPQQDTTATAATDTTAGTTMTSADTATAPDGSKGFGFVPYVGVMGGWEQFDNERTRAGIPQALNADGTVNRHYKLAGALVQGVLGANIPLGPVFVGAEGNVAKGVSGDIDWEYGVAGRFGPRIGDSGLIFGKVGYQWVNFARFGDNSPDYHDWEYGIGFEVGPKDIGLGGLTGRSGLRLRGEVDTFGSAHSFRPMAGLVAHF